MQIRQINRLTLCALVSILYLSNIAAAGKSMYAITKHGWQVAQAAIRAYKIDSAQIEFQTELTLDCPIGAWRGPVGLASDASGYLFVTHENNETGGVEGIQIINAKMMTDLGVLEVEDSPDFAGIVFHDSSNSVYAIVRNSNYLHIFHWYPQQELLEEDSNSPVQLPQIGNYGCGLALDEVENILYVSTINDHAVHSNEIFCYDVTDWSWIETIEIEYDNIDYNATTVAVYNDGASSRFLYTGAYGGNDYLVKTDLNLYETDPNNDNVMIPKDIGADAIGIAVDPDTGLVYITQSDNKVAVYDTSDWINDPNDLTATYTDYESSGVVGPAGICVPIADISYKPAPENLTFYKTATIENDYDCIDPTDPNHDEVTYTIYFANPETDPNDPNYLGDVVIETIVDHLPAAANPLAVTITGGGSYNVMNHTVVWDNTDLGTLNPGDSGSVTVTIQIIGPAEPSGTVTNFVEFESEEYYKTYTLATDVCCWDGDIIYVDTHATGWNTGTSWSHAYPDLQNALARAANGCGDEIWVARGVYFPGSQSSDSFALVDDIEIYGGFNGTETSRSERDFVRNHTILSGDHESGTDNAVVVTADNTITSTAILDGFIITGATNEGIKCTSADPTVTNCVITDNDDEGITANASDPALSRCLIHHNGADGLAATNGSAPEITNCKIYRNTGPGLYCDSSVLTALNNCIYLNGNIGIQLVTPSAAATIRNNTVVYNADQGITYGGSYPPDVTNCILYYNNSDGSQYAGCSPTWSCFYDPNNPSGSSTPDGNHNITCDPNFVATDPNSGNFHLDPDSSCVDIGDDTDVAGGETDIDGDDRIYGDDVDMGADEVTCTDVKHNRDTNDDGVINLTEFAPFPAAWLTDPCDPNWNTVCDLNEDDAIDIDDLADFLDDWLWQACWRAASQGTWMMSMDGGFDMSERASAQAAAIADFRQAELAQQADPTLEELLAMVDETIALCEKIWQDDTFREQIDADTWKQFLDYLYDWQYELEEQLLMKLY